MKDLRPGKKPLLPNFTVLVFTVFRVFYPGTQSAGVDCPGCKSSHFYILLIFSYTVGRGLAREGKFPCRSLCTTLWELLPAYRFSGDIPPQIWAFSKDKMPFPTSFSPPGVFLLQTHNSTRTSTCQGFDGSFGKVYVLAQVQRNKIRQVSQTL